MANKYVSPSKLSVFLEKLKTIFAPLTHTHNVNDLADYTIDEELSATSENPVQNKVLDAEFEAVSAALGALELAIDELAAKTQTLKWEAWNSNDQ